MAARAFANRQSAAHAADDDALADARMMGATAAQIEDLKTYLAGEDAGSSDGIWPDHVAAVEAFLVASSQWRTTISSFNGRIICLFQALDYAAAQVAWLACGIVLTRPMLEQIETIQSTVADIWNAEATS